MSGPSTTSTSGDDMCLQMIGTGPTAMICKRPEDHKSITEDGIGHSATPFPLRANFVETALQMKQECKYAWAAGRNSNPQDTNPYE